jgi:signal transduction histidine kinase
MLDSQRIILDQLLVSVINAREQECARVSRLLHDQVGQVLSAVGLQLDVLRLDLKQQVPEIVGRTAEIQQLLEEAVTKIRELSFELNPAIVERAGLQFALDQLAGRFRKTFKGGLRLLFDSSVHLPRETANALYKIAECAIDNAVQHASCNQIEVLLRPSHRAVILEVRDNGCGFPYVDVRKHSPGLGLLMMEHYASEGGLEFSIRSTPGRGTVVRASRRIENKEVEDK